MERRHRAVTVFKSLTIDFISTINLTNRMTPENIKEIIQQNLNAEHVIAESADNVHFYLTVVSADFAGQSKIKQHKMVKDLFTAQFADETIHAMSLKTHTPEKWATLQAGDKATKTTDEKA